MSEFVSSINPMGNMDGVNIISQQPVNKETAAGEFSSIFLQQMLQKVFNDQGKDLWGGTDEMSPSYSDIFTQQIIKQLAQDDAFGFNKLIEESIAKRMPVNTNTEGIF